MKVHGMIHLGFRLLLSIITIRFCSSEVCAHKAQPEPSFCLRCWHDQDVSCQFALTRWPVTRDSVSTLQYSNYSSTVQYCTESPLDDGWFTISCNYSAGVHSKKAVLISWCFCVSAQYAIVRATTDAQECDDFRDIALFYMQMRSRIVSFL